MDFITRNIEQFDGSIVEICLGKPSLLIAGKLLNKFYDVLGKPEDDELLKIDFLPELLSILQTPTKEVFKELCEDNGGLAAQLMVHVMESYGWFEDIDEVSEDKKTVTFKITEKDLETGKNLSEHSVVINRFGSAAFNLVQNSKQRADAFIKQSLLHTTAASMDEMNRFAVDKPFLLARIGQVLAQKSVVKFVEAKKKS